MQVSQDRLPFRLKVWEFPGEKILLQARQRESREVSELLHRLGGEVVQERRDQTLRSAVRHEDDLPNVSDTAGGHFCMQGLDDILETARIFSDVIRIELVEKCPCPLPVTVARGDEVEEIVPDARLFGERVLLYLFEELFSDTNRHVATYAMG